MSEKIIGLESAYAEAVNHQYGKNMLISPSLVIAMCEEVFLLRDRVTGLEKDKAEARAATTNATGRAAMAESRIRELEAMSAEPLAWYYHDRDGPHLSFSAPTGAYNEGQAQPLYAAPRTTTSMDKGPWEVFSSDETGRAIGVISQDFEHDVLLRVDGDFYDDAQKLAYCEQLIAKLQSVTPQPVKVPDVLVGSGENCEVCGSYPNQNPGDDYCIHNTFKDSYVDGWNDCREAMLAAQELTK